MWHWQQSQLVCFVSKSLEQSLSLSEITLRMYPSLVIFGQKVCEQEHDYVHHWHDLLCFLVFVFLQNLDLKVLNLICDCLDKVILLLC